jgi:hypothetical protein
MFQTCKKNAFSAFLNKPIFQKQIANYCDYEMRMGIKGNSDSQIEQKLNDINIPLQNMNGNMSSFAGFPNKCPINFKIGKRSKSTGKLI